MNHLLDDDDDLNSRRDRELTLSTGAILGIFLGLVLVCGLFFAFGYNLGQKSKSTGTVTDTGTTSASPSSTGGSKPSAGSLTASAPVQAAPAATTNTTTPPPPTPAPVENIAATPESTAPAPAPVAVHPQPAAAPTPVASPTGTFVVQVAAISNRGDANMVVESLRRRGYEIYARTEADNLTHIQAGPFNTKAEAVAMRDKLLADGYSAIIK